MIISQVSPCESCTRYLGWDAEKLKSHARYTGTKRRIHNGIRFSSEGLLVIGLFLSLFGYVKPPFLAIHWEAALIKCHLIYSKVLRPRIHFQRCVISSQFNDLPSRSNLMKRTDCCCMVPHYGALWSGFRHLVHWPVWSIDFCSMRLWPWWGAPTYIMILRELNLSSSHCQYVFCTLGYHVRSRCE